MERTADFDIATEQFFINTGDNPFLNHRGKTRADYGYCVFGEVISGMDVIDAIRHVPTHNAGMHQNVPVEPVIIDQAHLVGPA
jgi:peptidyl-prolyl cis-trans isomerase B (cyclophilin B)